MVSVLWDLRLERATLGGALVLRQEAELLAQTEGVNDIVLYVVSNGHDRRTAEYFFNEVFASSHINFSVKYDSIENPDWPLLQDRAQDDFSYFSFFRLNRLFLTRNLVPRLVWREQVLEKAVRIRQMLPDTLIAIHLKYVAPYSVTESNADGKTWGEFFKRGFDSTGASFILLGDDELPENVTPNGKVYRAKDLGVGLGVQLALISMCKGFLGMASGVCTAANFSAVPHVLFKHPAHHRDEMILELGDSDRFPFASRNQKLLRTEVTGPVLDDSLKFILCQ